MYVNIPMYYAVKDHIQTLNTTNKRRINAPNTKVNLRDSVRTAQRAQCASITNTNYPNAVQKKTGNIRII